MNVLTAPAQPKMTAAAWLERIGRYPLVRKPGTVVITGDPETTFDNWLAQLREASPEKFEHMVADAEYLPKSPLAARMRAAVTAEQNLRDGGAR